MTITDEQMCKPKFKITLSICSELSREFLESLDGMDWMVFLE